MIARRWSWLLAGAALAWSMRAEANGRFPLAAQLVVDPLDASHIVVRTTFGPIQSTDSGVTWRWICERSAGYSGIFDPAFAIAEGGTLFGLSYALTRSDDLACSFSKVPGEIDAKYVVDLAVDPRDPTHVIAVTVPTEPGPLGSESYFFDSRDGGRFFVRFGDVLPAGFVPQTVELAASRPARIYLSGTRGAPPAGVLLRSDDGGATWAELPLDLAGGKAPYIAAVDPTDPDRLFVRLDREPGDRLAMSTDGGETFVDAFSATSDLYGFALSPDGSRVAVGGPTDGIFVADSHALSFIKTSDIAARCLTWSAAGLWACVDETPTTFAVGLSTDEGKTFARRYHLRDLTPLECPAGTTTGDRCAEDWPGTRATLGIDDAGPDAVTTGDAALDARSNDASGGSSGGDPEPVSSDDTGCSCNVRARPHDRRALVLLALMGLSVLARARARREGREGREGARGDRDARRPRASKQRVERGCELPRGDRSNPDPRPEARDRGHSAAAAGRTGDA